VSSELAKIAMIGGAVLVVGYVIFSNASPPKPAATSNPNGLAGQLGVAAVNALPNLVSSIGNLFNSSAPHAPATTTAVPATGNG